MNRVVGRKLRKRRNMGKIFLIYQDMRKGTYLFIYFYTHCHAVYTTTGCILGTQASYSILEFGVFISQENKIWERKSAYMLGSCFFKISF